MERNYVTVTLCIHGYVSPCESTLKQHLDKYGRNTAVVAWQTIVTNTQSINQSIMLFRVVQVTKSLQDPLEVGNSLLGIGHNVRE